MAIRKTFVWQTGAGEATDFELEYLSRIVFADVDHEKVFDAGALSHPARDLVVFGHNSLKIPSAIEDYLRQHRPEAILHLSGERLPPVGQLYDDARVVLRSYYDPRIARDNLFALPLGFKTGLLNEGASLPVAERSTIWFFAGQVKSHRADMLSCLSHIAPHKTHLTSGWSSADGLGIADMRRYLADTIFIPCPFGNINPDSFRMMEGLEFGAIPVCVRFMGTDYYRYMFGDHPFIVGADWRDAALMMKDLLSDPQRLAARQRDVVAWYARFKARLAQDVAALLDGRAQDVSSEQFRYQREGRSDPLLKRVFELHFGKSLSGRIYRKAPFLFSGTVRRMERRAVSSSFQAHSL